MTAYYLTTITLGMKSHSAKHSFGSQMGCTIVTKDGSDIKVSKTSGYCDRIYKADTRTKGYRYCQPKKTSQSGIIGEKIEILLRMRGVDNEVISPAMFLPAAEQFHLMPVIDHWVITNTLVWFEENHQYLKHHKIVSINLSGQSLNDSQFLSQLIHSIKNSTLPPNLLCFEITETVAINNYNQVKNFISEIKKIGCHFSLDDFGAGKSSFAYLKHMPVDYLKIDGMFVPNICSSNIDYALVKSMHDVGHALGMKTVAEFVDGKKTEDCLKDIGVDYFQGYGIANATKIRLFVEVLQ